MNIVQVGSYPLSAACIRGGVESSVYGLVQAFIRAGHRVDIFDFQRIGGTDTTENEGLLTIHRYANKGRHNQDAVQRCDEMLRDVAALHSNVVHVHGTREMSSTIYKAAKNVGLSAVLTVHGLLHEEKKQAFRRKPSLKHLYQLLVQTRTERNLLNSAHRIIVDTPYVERMLIRYHRKGKIAHLPEIHIIPQGINAVYYGLSCNSESQTILSVGAISHRKGHIYTVKMFEQLRAKGLAVRLRIIGSLADSKYYAMLSQTIKDSPYKADISLETNVGQDELLRAYQSARLFVLHTQEESQGIVFAEAMAVGLPVVATKVGGVPDVIEHGSSGYLCDFGDTRTMADKAAELLTDNKRWTAFSNRAREISSKYDWDHIAEQIFALYKV